MVSIVSMTSVAQSGCRHHANPCISFSSGKGYGNVIRIHPDKTRQTIYGIGGAFTESSAFVLAHLEPAERELVMRDLFGRDGANLTFCRTVIGSTDFSVDGCYSYVSDEVDAGLQTFSIACDMDGFDRTRFSGIVDENYDLIPMIQQALTIKRETQDIDFRIIASAWTAPPWMKDIGRWYIKGDQKNDFLGTGGHLLPEYYSLYADYLMKYVQAYHGQGIPIWGMTPVNEPGGNSGCWESMHFTAESQRDWIRYHLVPAMHSHGCYPKIFVYDHNRSALEQWAKVMYSDPVVAQHVEGAAVHWYDSSYRVYEEVFNRVHDRYPEHSIIHSEGCVDSLGVPAPAGVLDPDGFQESGWFGNDDFWWTKKASDWAYSATWPGVTTSDHPLYAPVHRYAKDIIVGINNWLGGWIDWNLVLDSNGGPNHAGNFCGAPIMVDIGRRYVYRTPVFYILSQLSRSIRPGDIALLVEQDFSDCSDAQMCACATVNAANVVNIQIFNAGPTDCEFCIQVGNSHATSYAERNSLTTLQIQI